MLKAIANFKKYHYLLWQLVKKEIKLKYRNSVLGLLWTLLEPLLTMVVLVFVFSSFLGKGTRNFPVYILSGRLIYSFFANTTKSALKSVRSHGGMIKKVYVPKYMYPASSCISGYITFLISMIVLLFVMLQQKVWPTVHIVRALYPFLILFVLTLGVSLILSTLAVFFRDLEYLWGIALMLIMYASAIFYRAEDVINGKNMFIFRYNPLFAIIDNFRSAVFGLPMNSWYMLYSGIFALCTLFIGTIVFYINQDRFILYL